DFLFLPGNVAGYRIHADTDNFGAVAGELFELGIEHRQLRRTNRGPVRRIKYQHNVLLSPVVAQFDALPDIAHHRRQIEIRRLITNVNGCHCTPPIQMAILESAATSRKLVYALSFVCNFTARSRLSSLVDPVLSSRRQHPAYGCLAMPLGSLCYFESNESVQSRGKLTSPVSTAGCCHLWPWSGGLPGSPMRSVTGHCWRSSNTWVAFPSWWRWCSTSASPVTGSSRSTT